MADKDESEPECRRLAAVPHSGYVPDQRPFNLYRSLIDGSSIGFALRKKNYEISPAGAEIEFTYKGRPYAILNWGRREYYANHKLMATSGNVHELLNAIRIDSRTLEQVFNEDHREDNRGELAIDGLSYSVSDL